METAAALQLEPSWKAHVGDWFAREDMRALAAFLRQRKAAGARIYPPGRDIFAAFEATPFDAVKVVVLGQDPYHGAGQAHGLCFSVPPGVPVPPSLLNIYKELERDTGFTRPDHGCLLPWARRGVLLLNSVLTVEDGKPGSHQGNGWEGFTDHVVDVLNREREQPGVPALGQLRAEEGRGDRPAPAPRAEGAAPVAAVGAPRLPRLRAFLGRQRVPGALREDADRLVAAAGRAAPCPEAVARPAAQPPGQLPGMDARSSGIWMQSSIGLAAPAQRPIVRMGRGFLNGSTLPLFHE